MKKPSCVIPSRTFRWLIFVVIVSGSCTSQPGKEAATTSSSDQGHADSSMVTLMQRHLDAVSNRDLETLENTLSPQGNMQLILPGMEMMNSAEEFMAYHREWFQDTTWTFDTNILNTEIGDRLGMAITEIVYREPDRNGKPYFNRMIVSYVLEKNNGQWYVIKDHASSVEKSQP